MKILSGSSNLDLAQKIATRLSAPLLDIEISHFANQEKRVWVKDSVKGDNVIVVQSFSFPTDEHIIEFLLMVDALERGEARNVNAVIPWLGYSLQDKVFRAGEPIAAKVVADLVSNSYTKRAFLLDLHNSSTPGFFSIPTQHLTALDLFVQYAQEHLDLSQAVVASPDFGGLKRARTFAEQLQLDLVNIDKHRDLQTGEVSAMGLNGEVQGKVVVLFDDVISTGSTVVSAAELLKNNGATEVHFFATHGIFAQNGLARIEAAPVDSVVISNSITQPISHPKLKSLDLSPLFAQALSTWA